MSVIISDKNFFEILGLRILSLTPYQVDRDRMFVTKWKN